MNIVPQKPEPKDGRKYRNLSCAGCGKRIAKSAKPQGEAKCRVCMCPTMKQYDLVCQYCGDDYKSVTNKGKYCSDHCNSRAYEDKNRTKCIDCDELSDRDSDRCMSCASRVKATYSDEKRLEVERKRELMSRLVKPKVVQIGQCEACDTMIVLHTGNTKLCEKCKQSRFNARHKARKARRRAKLRGVYTERVKAEDVYARDDYTCLICYEPLDMTAKYPEPLSPSIDHIIPISLGGEHTMRNLRSAHFLCNSVRGNQYDPELDIPFNE